MPNRPPKKKGKKEQREEILRSSFLSPEAVELCEEQFRNFTLGSLPLAEEMELSMFTAPEPKVDDEGNQLFDEEGEPLFIEVEVSEAEEIQQMGALAWAHALENDLRTYVLPAVYDGSWKLEAAAWTLEKLKPGVMASLQVLMERFKEEVREASVLVAKSKKAEGGSGGGGDGVGES